MNTKTSLVVSVVVALIVGFLAGRMTAGTDLNLSKTSEEENTSVEQEQNTEREQVADSNLTEGQKKLLESMGIDSTKVVITAEMAACANGKLGVARMEEIKNGATPSMTEGVSLLVCYK